MLNVLTQWTSGWMYICNVYMHYYWPHFKIYRSLCIYNVYQPIFTLPIKTPCIIRPLCQWDKQRSITLISLYAHVLKTRPQSLFELFQRYLVFILYVQHRITDIRLMKVTTYILLTIIFTKTKCHAVRDLLLSEWSISLHWVDFFGVVIFASYNKSRKKTWLSASWAMMLGD